MRVLIAGARGYIGAAALRRLRADGTKVLPMSSSPSKGFGWLGLGNPQSFDSISIRKGDFILLTAAISSPDVCAKEPERVRRVNVEGTNEFISLCIRQGARVIFFSSDTVYGERAEEFNETASCNPAGDYAVMKHEVVQGAIALTQRGDEFPQSIINFGGPEVLARTEFAKILQDAALPNLRFRVTEPDADFFKNRPKVI